MPRLIITLTTQGKKAIDNNIIAYILKETVTEIKTTDYYKRFKTNHYFQ